MPSSILALVMVLGVLVPGYLVVQSRQLFVAVQRPSGLEELARYFILGILNLILMSKAWYFLVEVLAKPLTTSGASLSSILAYWHTVLEIPVLSYSIIWRLLAVIVVFPFGIGFLWSRFTRWKYYRMPLSKLGLSVRTEDIPMLDQVFQNWDHSQRMTLRVRFPSGEALFGRVFEMSTTGGERMVLMKMVQYEWSNGKVTQLDSNHMYSVIVNLKNAEFVTLYQAPKDSSQTVLLRILLFRIKPLAVYRRVRGWVDRTMQGPQSRGAT